MRYCTAFIGGAPVNLPKGILLSVGHSQKEDPLNAIIQHAVIGSLWMAAQDAVDPTPSHHGSVSETHRRFDPDVIISVLSFGRDAWKLLYRSSEKPDQISLALRPEVDALMPPGALIATALTDELRNRFDADGHLWVHLRDRRARLLKHRRLGKTLSENRYLWFQLPQ